MNPAVLTTSSLTATRGMSVLFSVSSCFSAYQKFLLMQRLVMEIKSDLTLWVNLFSSEEFDARSETSSISLNVLSVQRLVTLITALNDQLKE